MNGEFLTLPNTDYTSNAAMLFGKSSALRSSDLSEKTGSADFSSLLAKKIMSKKEENDNQTSKEAYNWTASFGASMFASSASDFFNPINSVSKATTIEKVEKPKQETATENKAANKSEETEKTSENKETDASEKTESKEEVNLNVIDEDTLKELLDSLSDEDKEILMADTSNFAENLAKIVDEMPDSELKEDLTKILDDKNLVANLQTALTSSKNKTVKAEETAVVAEENTVEENVQVSADTKVETGKTKIEQQANVKSSLSEESLRDEFARIHNLDEKMQETEETISQPINVVEHLTDDMTSIKDLAPELKMAAEQLIEKFFASSQDVRDASQQIRSSVRFETYNSEGQSNLQVKAAGSSSANSSNNSFSFQSGHSENGMPASSKAANSAPVAHTSFAEMLQKAELVKTKDGSKVLNIEVDQQELGKLEMELKSKDGTVTARLSAENEEIKTKIEEVAPRIIEQLTAQGVNVIEINVDVSSKHSDKNSEYGVSEIKRSSGRSYSVDFADALSEAEEGLNNLDVISNLRRAALNIQYIDEIV